MDTTIVADSNKQSEQRKLISDQLIQRVVTEHAVAKGQIKVHRDALGVMAEALQLFAEEGLARALLMAKKERSPSKRAKVVVDATHLEAVLVQLLLDWS